MIQATTIRRALLALIALTFIDGSAVAQTGESASSTTVTVTDDGCDCETFRSLARIGTLSSDAAWLGMNALDSSGRAFYRSPEEQQMLSLRIQAHELVPSRCWSRLGMSFLAPNPEYNRLTLYSRWGLGMENEPYVRSSEAPDRIMGAYRTLIDQFSVDCKPANSNVSEMSEAEQSAYASCLREKGPEAYGRFSRDLAGKSDQQVLTWLNGLGVSGVSASDVEVMRAFHLALNAADEPASLAVLRGYRNRLSDEQVTALIQMVGKRRRESYDTARNEAGVSAEGSVTYGDGLAADRNNEMYRFRGDKGAASMSAAEFAGICRDIASHQGQVAEALGMRNCYVVSFGRSSPSYHVTLTCQDRDENKLQNFDYGETWSPAAGTSSALFQGITDHTLVYRVCKPGGRCVATIDSDFRRFVDEAAGFDIQTLDPLARSRSSMHAANLALSADGGSAVRVGYGDDSHGQHLFFAGTHSWGAGTGHHGQIGATIGTSYRSEDRYPGASPVTANYLYFRVDQHASPSWQVGERTRLTWDNRFSVAGAMTHHNQAGSDKDGMVNGHGDFRYATGLTLDWQPTDATRVIARVEGQASPSILDIRDNSVQAPIAALDHVMGSVEVRHNFRDIALAAEATVVGNELGTRGRFQAGAYSDIFGITAGYEGRLGENTALFQEGSGRGFFWNAYIQPNEHLRGQVQLRHDLDAPADKATSGFLIGEVLF